MRLEKLALYGKLQACVLLGWYIILPELDPGSEGVSFGSAVDVTVTVLVGFVPEVVTLSFGQRTVE